MTSLASSIAFRAPKMTDVESQTFAKSLAKSLLPTPTQIEFDCESGVGKISYEGTGAAFSRDGVPAYVQAKIKNGDTPSAIIDIVVFGELDDPITGEEYPTLIARHADGTLSNVSHKFKGFDAYGNPVISDNHSNPGSDNDNGNGSDPTERATRGQGWTLRKTKVERPNGQASRGGQSRSHFPKVYRD
jgi:hypothetical protein